MRFMAPYDYEDLMNAFGTPSAEAGFARAPEAGFARAPEAGFARAPEFRS